MKLIVNRAFLLGGVVQQVGDEIEVTDRALESMLVYTGKASAADPAAETESGLMTTETAAAAVRGKTKPRASDDAQPDE